MRRSYDHIISLGCDCRVAYNARMTFGFSRAFPFDWWVTPLSSLIRFLEDPDVEKLYAPDLLHRVCEDGHAVSVENAHYQIWLHHEFPRVAGDVVEDFRSHIENPKRRTAFLLDRFLSLAHARERVLFVRYAGSADAPSAAKWRSETHCLMDMLKSFGFRKFRLLLVNPPYVGSLRGTRALQFEDNASDWKGDGEAWRKHLLKAAKYRGAKDVTGAEPLVAREVRLLDIGNHTKALGQSSA